MSLCKHATLVHPISTVEDRARRLTMLMLSRMRVVTVSQNARKDGVRLALDIQKGIVSEVFNIHTQ